MRKGFVKTINPTLLFFKNEANLNFSKNAVKAYAATFTILLVAYIQPYIPIDHLTRDTIALTGGKVYFGLISNIGLFFWFGSLTVAIFTLSVLNKVISYKNRLFIISNSVISGILLLDDFLQLHEEIFPKVLGINENLFYVIYILMMASFLIYYYKLILKSQWILLFSSLAFLALSMLSDKILKQTGSIVIIEDGLKFLGITGWFAFIAKFCFDTITDTSTNISQQFVK